MGILFGCQLYFQSAKIGQRELAKRQGQLFQILNTASNQKTQKKKKIRVIGILNNQTPRDWKKICFRSRIMPPNKEARE